MKVTARASAGRETETLTTYSDVQLVGTRYPSVYLKTGDMLIQPLLETVQSTGVTTLDTREVECREVSIREIVSEPVFFFCYNLDNYFHFLYDALPTLVQYIRLRSDRIRLLLPEGSRYRFVTETLEILGIYNVLTANEHTLYKKVLVASSPTHEGESNAPPHPSVWEVYERLRTLAGPPPLGMAKKIYISRRSWVHGDTSNIGTNYTTRRKMMCEDDLVKALERQGYAEVFCELMTMREKIQLFSQATHVVGAIGGGMCNLVFSSPQTSVLCLCSPEFERINRRFLYTMDHTQLRMFRNTQTTSNLYRRAKIWDSIGEVLEDNGDTLLLGIGNGVTWGEGMYVTPLIVRKSEVTFLDEGLNSPWTFSVAECMKLI